MTAEFGKGSMGAIGGVGSPGCIFEMEPILLLLDQRLGEKQSNQKEEARKIGRCREIFLLDLVHV